MVKFLGRGRRVSLPRDAGRERRATNRYDAEGAATLGWWDGPEFQRIPAKMKDVSMGGAAVLVNTPPPEVAPVWIKLDRPSAPDWVEATICGGIPTGKRPSLLRLQFLEACPYEVFKGSVAGLDVTGRAEHVSPEFSELVWR